MLIDDIDNLLLNAGAVRYRNSMGPSSAYHPCQRKTWFDFRNVMKDNRHLAKKDDITKIGKKLRTFETGHQYESRILDYLMRLPNVQIIKSQAEFNDDVIHGFIDAIAKIDGEIYVIEIKSMGDKYFNKLKDDGCEVNNPSYYIQCQIYMHYSEIKKCILLVENKNTNEMYEESIDYVSGVAITYIELLKRLARQKEPPKMISQDPSYYICKMCDFFPVCHNKQPVRNSCRTCVNFEIGDGGIAMCKQYKKAITLEKQHVEQDGTKCPNYSLLPEFAVNNPAVDNFKKELESIFNTKVTQVF